MNALGRLAREESSRRQKDATRAALLARCRELMEGGNFRPTAAEIAGTSPHHITNLFGTLPTLHEQALDDITAAAIARLMGSEPHRVARAAVFGRLST